LYYYTEVLAVSQIPHFHAMQYEAGKVNCPLIHFCRLIFEKLIADVGIEGIKAIQPDPTDASIDILPRISVYVLPTTVLGNTIVNKALLAGCAWMDRIWMGRELRSLNNLIHRYFEFSSHKKEVEIITGNNGWIVGYLAKSQDKDIYQKDLEDYFTIARSTASKVLRLMEQKGLIQRQSVAHDARLKKVVLTEKGWKTQALMKEDAESMEDSLMKGFTDEELRTLYSYIQRMKENISSVKPIL